MKKSHFLTRAIAALTCIALVAASLPAFAQSDINLEALNWDTYTHRPGKFTITHPIALITPKTRGKNLFLTHSIPYTHADVCDFRGNARRLKKLTDFNVRVMLVKKSFKGAVKTYESDYVEDFLKGNSFTEESGFIEPVTVGKYAGWVVHSGVEGCGESTYYFRLARNKTLVVKRKWITELSAVIGNFEENLALPGVINPEDEEALFIEMIGSIELQ